MAQTFFPDSQKSIKIAASQTPPENCHPVNTNYVISIGTEMWGSTPHSVLKVQMEYDGKLSGRRSPSYPIGTDDYERVQKAIQKLISIEEI